MIILPGKNNSTIEWEHGIAMGQAVSLNHKNVHLIVHPGMLESGN